MTATAPLPNFRAAAGLPAGFRFGAVADRVDVRRYHAWSLLDDFEGEHGYGKRFGIVDYATQQRIPKRCGLWYRDHIAAARGGGR